MYRGSSCISLRSNPTEVGEPIIDPMARKLHRDRCILCAIIFAIIFPFLFANPF
jgi:hypothetical protein